MQAFGDNSKTLEAVRNLSSEISAAADQGEKNRHVLPEVVDKLRGAGIFRMMVPKHYGGDALSVAQACAVIEELAASDAAAAWTAMVALGFNVALAHFARTTVDAIYAKHGPDVGVRGALAPIGQAVAAAGGYSVSGRWPFASGPYKPDWMVAGAVVMENGKPRMGPMGPQTRLVLVPPEKVEFLDTWHTVGLCGTDSRDYQFKDVFVAEDHTTDLFDFSVPQCYDDSLFNLPFPLLAGPTHSAVCLGITRAALNEVAVLARTKRGAFSPGQTMGESPIFQNRLGELAVRHASLQALLEQQVREVPGLDPATGPMHLARHASYTGYIHVQSVDIVNELFTLAGSTPCYSKSTLQRRWRDVRVVAQHMAGSTAHYPAYGAQLVGLPPRAAPGQ